MLILVSKAQCSCCIAKCTLWFENKWSLFEYVSQLSASGDSGVPEVVADPQSEVSKIFQNLGVCVVQQCAKIRQQGILFLLGDVWERNAFYQIYYNNRILKLIFQLYITGIKFLVNHWSIWGTEALFGLWNIVIY